MSGIGILIKITNFAKKIIMKKFALYLVMMLFIVSCKEDVVIDEPPANPYGVVFENGTNGQLFIQSRQLVMGSLEILPGETSKPVYGNVPNVSITYYGEGTHFKKIKKDIVLTKDNTSRIVLDYPPAP